MTTPTAPLTTTPLPRRRFVLELKLGADDREELVHALESVADDLRRCPVASCNVASGGCASGYTLQITEDPTVTHDSYFAAIKALK